MKFSSIPHLYRDLNRSIEIVGVLSKYGLADWIHRLDLDFAKGIFRDRSGHSLAEQSLETRIRLALIELGPTFIKLGQVLSTRPDIVGAALATELAHLQTRIPADPPEVVRDTITRELGQAIDDIFAEFDDEPLASASIGQVHRAQLRSGELVVVKVQHADIEEKVRIDLEILQGLAQLAEHVAELRNFCPRETTAEFQRSLLRELNFDREERNIQEFRAQFARDASVKIPRPFSKYTTGRVLTMEYLDGVKISEIAELEALGYDIPKLATRGSKIFLSMIFDHGFYHADPHPGNVIVLPGGIVGILDCGLVGRVDDPMREQVEALLLAISNKDIDELQSIIMRLASVPNDLDEQAFRFDLAEFVSHYAALPLSQLNVGELLSEMTEIMRRYHILLPAALALLIRALMMLEGTAKQLNPEINITELLEPYRRRLLWRRMDPLRKVRQFQRIYHEWEHLTEVLPHNLIDLMQQFQTGRFEVRLEHEGLEPSVNRLVLGMLASALFLGSTILWASNVPPVINGISILGAAGSITSFVLALRLFWAIRKSGYLDRRKPTEPRGRGSMR